MENFETESAHSLAIDGDWMTVVSASENTQASTSKSSHFLEHLLISSFRQSLLCELIELENILIQLLNSSKDTLTQYDQLVTYRKEIHEMVLSLNQLRFLKSVEVISNVEYRET